MPIQKVLADAGISRDQAKQWGKTRSGACGYFFERLRAGGKGLGANVARSREGQGSFRSSPAVNILPRKGDEDRAIAGYSEAIGLDPKLRPGLPRPRQLLAAKRDNDRSIADFNESIRLDLITQTPTTTAAPRALPQVGDMISYER